MPDPLCPVAGERLPLLRLIFDALQGEGVAMSEYRWSDGSADAGPAHRIVLIALAIDWLSRWRWGLLAAGVVLALVLLRMPWQWLVGAGLVGLGLLAGWIGVLLHTDAVAAEEAGELEHCLRRQWQAGGALCLALVLAVAGAAVLGLVS